MPNLRYRFNGVNYIEETAMQKFSPEGSLRLRYSRFQKPLIPEATGATKRLKLEAMEFEDVLQRQELGYHLASLRNVLSWRSITRAAASRTRTPWSLAVTLGEAWRFFDQSCAGTGRRIFFRKAGQRGSLCKVRKR